MGARKTRCWGLTQILQFNEGSCCVPSVTPLALIAEIDVLLPLADCDTSARAGAWINRGGTVEVTILTGVVSSQDIARPGVDRCRKGAWRSPKAGDDA